MPDLQTTTKLAETSQGHLTWAHMIFGMIVGGLTGGFFNPIWKFIFGRFKNKEEDIAIKVAGIHKDEHTEVNLWARIESLETKLQIEIDKRISGEGVQEDLKNQIDDLKKERLLTLSRYIHLKIRIEEAKREVEYLKSKLREKDPDFDKDYPNFSAESDALANEKLIEELIEESK